MDYIVSVKPRTKKITTNNCNVKDIRIKKRKAVWKSTVEKNSR